MTALHKQDNPMVVIGGQRFKNASGEVRVLVAAEGYAMVRQKGCLPFVVSIMELYGEWSQVDGEVKP
jgi:hypothetical protein